MTDIFTVTALTEGTFVVPNSAFALHVEKHGSTVYRDGRRDDLLTSTLHEQFRGRVVNAALVRDIGEWLRSIAEGEAEAALSVF